jgi:hypothetical protein
MERFDFHVDLEVCEIVAKSANVVTETANSNGLGFASVTALLWLCRPVPQFSVILRQTTRITPMNARARCRPSL